MSFDGFLNFGGTEIVNAQRTTAYIRNLMPNFPLVRRTSLYDNLNVALGDDPYRTPFLDQADWIETRGASAFLPSNPSHGFYGLYPLSIEGVGDSTMTAAVVENILDGGFVNSQRDATRSIRVRGLLVGEDTLAVETGLTWLRNALRANACTLHGDGCGYSDLRYFLAQPTVCVPYFAPDDYDFGDLAQFGTVNLETSPVIYVVDTQPEMPLRTEWILPPTDAQISWGALDYDSGDVLEQYGPLYIRRSNYIQNPTFAVGTSFWTPTSGSINRLEYQGRTYARLDQPTPIQYRNNWLPETSFENGEPELLGWRASTPIVRGTGVGAFGTRWAEVSGSSTNWIEASAAGPADLTTGTFSFYSTEAGTYLITVADNAGAPVFVGNIEIPAGAGWKRGSISGAPIADNYVVRISTSLALLKVDALQFEVGAVATSYFDGDFIAYDYDWTGTPNNSISVKLEDQALVTRNLFENPSFETVISGTDVIATNLVTNPSFETGASVTTVRTNLATSPNGLTSRTVYVSVVDAAVLETSPNPRIINGTSYEAARVRETGPADTSRLGIRIAGVSLTSPSTIYLDVFVPSGMGFSNSGGWICRDDPNGDSLAADFITPQTSTFMFDQWSRVEVQIAPKVGRTVTSVYFTPGGDPALGGGAYWDSACFMALAEYAPGAPFFDGSTPSAGDFTYAWTGAANASTTLQRAPQVVGRQTLAPSIVHQSQVRARTGTKSARIVAPTPLAADHSVLYPNVNFVGTAGRTYTWSMRIWRPAGTPNLRLRLVISGETGASTTLFEQWETISVNFVANGDSQLLRLRTVESFPAQTEFWVDDEMIVEGLSNMPYFDGSTSGNGYLDEWTGTANASTSTRKAQLATIYENLATNPSFETALAGASTVRTNFAPNPSVEVDLTNWTITPGPTAAATLSRVTTGGVQGSAFARGTWTAAATGVGGFIGIDTTDVVGMRPSHRYTSSAWVRVNRAMSISVRGTAYNGAATTGFAGGSAIALVANQWTRVSFTQTISSTSNRLVMEIRSATGSDFQIGDTLDVDGVLIEQTDQLRDYFDGATPDALGYDYAWAGVANASVSTAKANRVAYRTNLITNPSVETNITGWTGNATSALAASTAQAFSGTTSLIATATGANAFGVFSPLFPVTAGTPYNGLAHIRDITTNVTFSTRIEWRDAGGNTVGTPTVGTAVDPFTSNWTPAYLEGAVAPVGATQGRLAVYSTTAPAAGTQAYFDGFLAEAGTGQSVYFDGSTNSLGDFQNGWSGTAHASTSQQTGVSPFGLISTTQATAVLSREWASTGSTSLRISPTTSGNDSSVRFGVTTVVGRSYTVQAKIRLVGALSGILSADSRKIVVLSSAFARLAESPAAPQSPGVTTLTATFVATTTSSNIILNNGASVGQRDVWWDDLVVTEGPVPSYFDGSNRPANDMIYSWSGTPQASTSLARAPRPTGVSMIGGQARIYHAYNSDGTSVVRFVLETVGSIGLPVAPTTTLTTGEIYTVLMRLRTLTRTTNFAPRIRATTGPTATAALGVWVESRLSIAAGAGTVGQTGILLSAGGGYQPGDVIEMDTALVTEGTYAGPYFDGNTVGNYGEDFAYYFVGGPGGYSQESIGFFQQITVETAATDAPFGPFVLSFEARAPETTPSAWVEVVTPEGEVIASRLFSPGQQWERYAVGGDFGRKVKLRFTSSTGYFEIDNVMLEATTTLNDYFDGSSPAPSDYEVIWEGTANGSISRMNWLGSTQIERDSNFRPFLNVLEGEIDNVRLAYSGKSPIPIQFQIEPVDRTYHGVTCTVGPQRIRDLKLDTGAATEIDFILTAANPHAISTIAESIGVPFGEAPELIFDRAINVAPNPSGENAITGWGPIPGTGGAANTTLQAATTPYGTNVIRTNWTTATTAVSGGVQIDVPVQGGGLYSFEMNLVRTSINQRIQFQVEWRTASATISNFGAVSKVHVAGVSQSHSFEGLTAPANATVARVKVTSIAGTGAANWSIGSNLEVDGLMVNYGSTAYDYFDGSTPDTSIYTYAWTGTAGLSTSFREITQESASVLVDPALPATPAPPRPPTIPDLAIEEINEWLRYYAVIPAGNVAVWADTVPTFELSTGAEAIRQLRVRFFANPFDREPDEVDPTSYCGEFLVSYLPANSTLTVSGVSEQAWVSVSGGAPIPANQLLYGTDGAPMEWPELSCGISYVVAIDVPPTESLDNLEIELVVNRRE